MVSVSVYVQKCKILSDDCFLWYGLFNNLEKRKKKMLGFTNKKEITIENNKKC